MSAKEQTTDGAAASAPAGAGAKTFLPLILNLILMPALAFAMTQFVLIPKLRPVTADAAEEASQGDAKGAASDSKEKKESKPDGEKTSEKGGRKEGKAGAKVTANLSGKILVNVAGTMGTRYLVANLTLVGKRQDFKDLVDKYDPQLRDAAMSTLASKTIPDLEKPGARNIIRSELMSVFNNVLGEGVVNEIYLTEFAIQ
jgi:flagellar FliL protein